MELFTKLNNAVIKLSNFLDLYYLKNKHPILFSIIKKKLTYLEPKALLELVDEILTIRRNKVEGIVIEAGCALGGSAIAITSYKEKARPLLIFDIFDMIPPPSINDGSDALNRYKDITIGMSEGIKGEKYYGYEEDLIEKVKFNFLMFDIDLNQQNVNLIKGMFEDTMNISQPVALAHIDCDWYESVSTCLKRIVPNLVTGGKIIIDDYKSWSGCKKAVDEYFINKENDYEFVQKRRLHIIKK